MQLDEFDLIIQADDVKRKVIKTDPQHIVILIIIELK